jgi:hypothetical protein
MSPLCGRYVSVVPLVKNCRGTDNLKAVRHWMKEPKRWRIDPELEKNTGPNLAEHPLWKAIQKTKAKKAAERARDRRVSGETPDSG